ncbi:acyltransferase family protein [Methylobacterium sp. P31]
MPLIGTASCRRATQVQNTGCGSEHDCDRVLRRERLRRARAALAMACNERDMILREIATTDPSGGSIAQPELLMALSTAEQAVHAAKVRVREAAASADPLPDRRYGSLDLGRSPEESGHRVFSLSDRFPKRAPGLDLLRAIAILWVMWHHAMAYHSGSSQNPVAQLGWMGVDLFFVLSGYLIGAQIIELHGKNQKFGYLYFYRRRAYRIIPAYIATLTIYFSFPALREISEIQPLWQFITFSENFFVDIRNGKSFSHVWSLCVEEHFYLVAPLLLWALMRRQSIWAAMAACCWIVIGGIVLRSYIWVHQIAPLQGVPEHSAEPRAGICGAHLLPNLDTFRRALRRSRAGCSPIVQATRVGHLDEKWQCCSAFRPRRRRISYLYFS